MTYFKWHVCFPKCSWSAIRYKQGNYIYYRIGKDSYNWWRNCSWVVWEAKQKFCFFAIIIPNWLSKTIQRICSLVFHILWELCVQILKKLATLVTIESTTKETTLKSTTKRLLALQHKTQQMVKMERAAAVRFFDLLLLHKGCQVYCNDYKFSQKRTDLRNLPEIFFFFFVRLFSYLQAVVRRCLTRRLFWKILQNSQKNTCTGVSFLRPPACNFIWKGTQKQVYACEPCKTFM